MHQHSAESKEELLDVGSVAQSKATTSRTQVSKYTSMSMKRRRLLASQYLHLFPCSKRPGSLIPPLFSLNEWENIKLYCRAGLAIHSSILFWIGGYDILYYTSTPSDGTKSLFEPSVWREIMYIMSGLLLMILTDTVYGNAGLPGGYFPEFCIESTPLLVIRALCGLIATTVMCVGTYTYLDEYLIAYSLERNILYLLGGMFGLVILGTFYDMAFVYPPGKNTDDIPGFHSPWHHHLKTSCRAILSIILQNMSWVGAFNLMEYYFAASIWRELTYIILGLFLFTSTNIFLPISWVVVTKEGEQKQIHANLLEADPMEQDPETLMENIHSEYTPTVAFYIRAVMALMAQFMHNSGCWQLMDVYISPNTREIGRNIICLFLGLVSLWGTGALLQNACIMPMLTPAFTTPEAPSEETIIAVAAAAELTENPIVDASVLYNAVSIMPSVRGRVRRKQLETELDESRMTASRFDRYSSDYFSYRVPDA